VWEKSRGGSTPLVSTFRKPDFIFESGFFYLGMFVVYAISSLGRNYIYVGLSSQLEKRLKRHNKGQNKTTKPYAPFKLIHSKEFETLSKARKYELYLKSGVGKELLRSLRDNNGI
tara:strand:- start:11071 stop:11415 length:345 start_codon:yes stop_codon:yes gene_type:complete